MHEELAGVEAHNLVGRHPAIRAADPKVLRCLLAFEPFEEISVGGDHPLCPGAVVCLQVIQHGCAYSADSHGPQGAVSAPGPEGEVLRFYLALPPISSARLGAIYSVDIYVQVTATPQ